MGGVMEEGEREGGGNGAVIENEGERRGVLGFRGGKSEGTRDGGDLDEGGGGVGEVGAG